MTDELLKALGRVQRAQQTEQARAGEAAEDWQRPLTEGEQATILAAVLGEAPATNVVPLARPRTRVRWLAGATTLAAAAALLLFVQFGGETGDHGPALPSYSLTRASGEMSVRGSEPNDAPIVLRSDTAIDWTLTPATATREPVDVRVVASQGDTRRWIASETARAVSADGVVRVRGRAGTWLQLPPGAWTLTFVLGRADALPRTVEDFEAGFERAQERGWQLQRVQVQIEG
jgi:hypothetical protein